MTRKEQKATQKFVDLMLKVTFRICHWNENGELIARSSGFLYKKDETSPLLVITAGHGTPPKGSFIETKYVYKQETVAINAGNFIVFYQDNNIDYAYSILPVELINKNLPLGAEFEFTVYKDSFVKAVKDEAYGFAVRNNYEFVRMEEGLIAPTYLCSELYLELEAQEEHINYFRPARPIMEHEYYQGASGSPIADTSGRICSILIGGTEPRKLLKAFRLDNIELP